MWVVSNVGPTEGAPVHTFTCSPHPGLCSQLWRLRGKACALSDSSARVDVQDPPGGSLLAGQLSRGQLEMGESVLGSWGGVRQ